MLQFLSSLKLTLALLLGLAGVAVVGTIRPLEENRYDLYYQSPWFRLGLALLALNLLACTLLTIRRNLRDRTRSFETLQGEQPFGVPLRYVLPASIGNEKLLAGLIRLGYRVEEQAGALLARRGLAGRWGSTVVHLAVLAIMGGALAAEWGFVGTLNLQTGNKSAVFFDWERQTDRPLGFEFRLDHFELVYYPIELQFAALDPVTREPREIYTVTEGDEVALPVPGARAKVLSFDPVTEDLVLGISRDGMYLGEYHAMGGKHVAPNHVDPGIELRPLAFRDPIVKQLRSDVSILEQGQVVRRATIEVNRPCSHRGVKIFQTAYHQDQFGFWSAGFQLTRDPAEPLVWIGCVLLVFGLLAAFVVPYRAVGVTGSGAQRLLVGLAGFRGEEGEAAFEALEKALVDPGPGSGPADDAGE